MQKYRVLLVDDEPWTLKGLKLTLPWKDFGMDISRAETDPEAALEYIFIEKPDIVFTDIRMPGLNGMELMERISHERIHTLFVVVSGHSDFEYVQKAIREGAFDYLLKPLDEAKGRDLLDRLARYLENPTTPEKEEPPIPDHREFAALVAYVRDNFHRKLALKQLAAQFALDYALCTRMFRETYGTSFSQFLTGLRIERAKALLANESLSVEAIAQMCGYDDYFYFNKVFTKAVDTTPYKYRRQ